MKLSMRAAVQLRDDKKHIHPISQLNRERELHEKQKEVEHERKVERKASEINGGANERH